MREGQSRQHIDRDIELRLQRERLTQLQQPLQIDALDELHRDEEVPVHFAEIVNADDVRVLEGRGGLRLVQESPPQIVLPRDRVVHHFDRDGTVQHRIPCLVHHSHRALAYELDDVVFANVRNCRVGHGHSVVHGLLGRLV